MPLAFRCLVALLFVGLSAAPISMADDINISTTYPSPFGSYDHLRLVGREDLPQPCLTGMLFVNQAGSLQYCHPTPTGGGWSAIGTRMERGSLSILKEGLYAVTFSSPFSGLPLIQTYMEIEMETPDGTKKSVGNITDIVIFDITNSGFVIRSLDRLKETTILWVAIGN